MMKQKIITLLFFTFLVLGCNTVNQKSHSARIKSITLDLDNCFLYNKKGKIQVNVLSNYEMKSVQDVGWCEYHFYYKDSSVFYVSTDTYSGSRLNSLNKYLIGIEMYRRDTILKDIIKNEGLQDNGKYWLEYILEDIAIGYVNVPLKQKENFNDMVNSIKETYH